MHFFIDENISPHIANALNHLAKLCSENHTVMHAREANGGMGMPDEVWLEQLKQSDKTWVILSKDRFQKGDPERLAFENCGITTINLGSDWKKKNVWETALRLIEWWPVISKEVLDTPGPMHYDLTWVRSPKLKGRKKAIQ
ncbi:MULTISPECIES: hypothetical protein [unclassified Halomonas]|uniref:PIN-like domain-containing protein n=1 Tax=unclassified Halomonas TaxID=2609666 RepID=UPI00099063DB|nr:MULTISPECIES: hypothetical protein [unclassified Halomonas]AQU84911.1 hypothetical protein B2G49_21375 [Halomonas sp. 'Soap Lake \